MSFRVVSNVERNVNEKSFEYAFPVETLDFDHQDPYMDAKTKKRIDADIVYFAEQGKKYYGAKSGPFNERPTHPDLTQPVTTALINAVGPQLRTWLEYIPSAAALYPIANVGDKKLQPNGADLAEELGRWFENMDVGIGIRARAAIEALIMRQILTTAQETKPTNSPVKILNLACGEGRNALQIISSTTKNGYAPHLTLVDLDKKALTVARGIAESHKLKNIDIICRNAVDRTGIAKLNISNLPALLNAAITSKKSLRLEDFKSLKLESYDMVSSIGFLEYLTPDDWYFKYDKLTEKGHMKMAGAKNFIKNAFAMVAPGGTLLVGNINLENPRTPGVEHPQIRFLTDVIQWGRLQPRTEAEMLDIISNSNIKPRKVTVYRTPEGLYNLYRIDK
jgi:2-polyprenyl-3-methyl-5-hydroxy-6-metoxy-1,4-benzoquinol methylase